MVIYREGGKYGKEILFSAACGGINLICWASGDAILNLEMIKLALNFYIILL